MPYVVSGNVEVGGTAQAVSLTGLSLGWLGAKGIFVGIICAFTSVHIYAWVERKGWVIKMRAGVPPTFCCGVVFSSDPCYRGYGCILCGKPDLRCNGNQRVPDYF